jgi:surface-anchored protein
MVRRDPSRPANRRPALRPERLEDRTVLNGTLDVLTGHLDGIAIDYVNGSWVGSTEDKDNNVRYAAGEVNLVAIPAARTGRPAGLDFIGVPAGADVWLLPQNFTTSTLYLGANSEATTPGALASYFESDPRIGATAPWIRVQVTGVRGPGQFSMWQAGFFGDVTTWVSTADGLSAADAFFLSEGAHTHYNWAFTARGYYEVDVQATAYLGPGQTNPTTSPVFTYYFSAERPGFLQFDSATYQQTEAGTLATVTVSRTRGTDGTVTVAYATGDGTAAAGSDYTATSGTLTFLNGETTKTFTVLLASDGEAEGPETVNLTLSEAGGGAKLGVQTAAVLTILDDPTSPPPPPPPPPAGGLQGGGFEAPDLAAGGFEYAPTGTPWAFAGMAGVAADGSGFTSGNPAAPEGDQVAFLQNTGAASQTVSLSAGTYQVRLRAAQRGNFREGDQAVRVVVGGATVGTFTPAGTGYETFTSDSFTLSADGTREVRLEGVGGAGDRTALVDLVEIVTPTSPPPPATPVALANAGFEAPGVGGGAFQYDPSGAGWTFSSQSGVTGNGSGFTGGNPDAPEGGQVAFLQGAGSVAQQVTLAAGTYTLSFRAAQRGNFNPDGPQTVRAALAGTARTFTPAGAGYEALAGMFTVTTAGTYTLVLDGTVAGDATALLDHIQLARVS